MVATAAVPLARAAEGQSVPIVGPSFAYTPQSRASQWSTWLAHVKSAGTVPDMITNHDEGDVDDPVTVAQALNSQLSAAGIPAPHPVGLQRRFEPAVEHTFLSRT